jgi:hypothetical protein
MKRFLDPTVAAKITLTSKVPREDFESTFGLEVRREREREGGRERERERGREREGGRYSYCRDACCSYVCVCVCVCVCVIEQWL